MPDQQDLFIEWQKARAAKQGAKEALEIAHDRYVYQTIRCSEAKRAWKSAQRQVSAS